jgi:hypothetical protein
MHSRRHFSPLPGIEPLSNEKLKNAMTFVIQIASIGLRTTDEELYTGFVTVTGVNSVS